jgi:hypothetical protein
MYSMPLRTVCTFLMSPFDAVAGEDVAERAVLPARHDDGQVLLAAASSHESFGSIW